MAKILIHSIKEGKQPKISRHIYGHFSEHLGRCIYGGFYVGEDSSIPNTHGIRNDVVEALRKIKIPNLRWPGGCFADEYHWKDGIGPKNSRPEMINTHWGGVTENNHFGTHEFFELCNQLDCEPYICGNLGSGTVREMQEWVEYITFDGKSPMADLRRKNGKKEPWKIKFWGVGNENWGCGGTMTGRYYSDEFYRYSTYLRNFSGNELYIIVCGPAGGGGERHINNWIESLLKKGAVYGVLGRRIHALTFHYYTVTNNWVDKGSATEFSDEEWYRAMRKTRLMEDFILICENVMNKYDPNKNISLLVDEWGAWHDVEPGTNPGFNYQQNTMRDAMIAAINLDIFNNHCDRVKMANIAQTLNVLQSTILTKDEKMILTPTYHVFDMYQVHQDAVLLSMEIESEEDSYYDGEVEQDIQIPIIHGSASLNEENQIHISLSNLSRSNNNAITIKLPIEPNGKCVAQILRGNEINSHNTFDNLEIIKPKEFSNFELNGSQLNFNMPSRSIIVFKILF